MEIQGEESHAFRWIAPFSLSDARSIESFKQQEQWHSTSVTTHHACLNCSEGRKFL